MSVSVTPNCNEFKEYVINFYNEGSWIGTFGQFMITMGGAEGTIEIDELIFEKNVMQSDQKLKTFQVCQGL